MQRIVACNSFMANTGLAVAGVGISVFPTRFMQPWIERGLLVSPSGMVETPRLQAKYVSPMSPNGDEGYPPAEAGGFGTREE